MWNNMKITKSNNGLNKFRTVHHYNDAPYNKNEYTEIDINKVADKNIIFDHHLAFKSPWKAFTKYIDFMRNILHDSILEKHIFVAGGSVFTTLFTQNRNDIDLFIYDADEELAHKIIRKLIDNITFRHNTEYNGIKILRTKNAITLDSTSEKIQIILRLYKTPSEIIHGFDVDCCCMGFNLYDNYVYMTDRCLYSIKNQVNTINFDRLSPSYEYRLVKYAKRGISIHINNLDHTKINDHVLIEYIDKYILGKEIVVSSNSNNIMGYSEYIDYECIDVKDKVKIIRKLRGLDILLLYDYMSEHKMQQDVKGTIDRLNKIDSDYSPKTLQGTNFIEDLLIYLLNSRKEYPIQYQKYKKYILTWYKSNKDKNNPYTYHLDELYIVKLDDDELDYINNISINEGSIYMEDVNLITDSILSRNFYRYIINIYFNKEYNHTILSEILDKYLNVPNWLYNILSSLKNTNFSQNIEFKTTKPGEQMTNTFNIIVLEDNNKWYNGQFYDVHSTS